MKKQKHYHTRDEILKTIDLEKKKFSSLMSEAERLDKEADALFKLPKGNYCLAEDFRLQAKVLRKKAYRKETVRIPRLGRTLAAFDTEPLGIPGNMEMAVVLQP